MKVYMFCSAETSERFMKYLIIHGFNTMPKANGALLRNVALRWDLDVKRDVNCTADRPRRVTSKNWKSRQYRVNILHLMMNFCESKKRFGSYVRSQQLFLLFSLQLLLAF